MTRRTTKINEDLCNGCGTCADTCHEGAIAIADGKARLIKGDYCDGPDDRPPICPTGAITFEEREVTAYGKVAVKARMYQNRNLSPFGVPFHRERPGSRLTQWPVQTKLAPVQAPYFKDTHLLVTTDCTVFAHGGLHNDSTAGRTTLTGCPKLDMADCSEKPTEIIRPDDIRGVIIVRMGVPCCDGIEDTARRTLQASGKFIPWQAMTVGTNGSLVRNQTHDIRKVV